MAVPPVYSIELILSAILDRQEQMTTAPIPRPHPKVRIARYPQNPPANPTHSTNPSPAITPIPLLTDGGFYGSLSWIDIERNYAGVVFFEDYTGENGSTGSGGARSQLIPIIEEAFDAVR